MSLRRPRSFLDGLEDLGVVLVAGPVREEEPTQAALADWRAAASAANVAYADWRGRRDRDSYVVYRACADRADAAQDALAARERV